MLRMKVKAVGLDRDTFLPVVILTNDGEDSYLPLVIGPAEANAIAVVLESVEISRPLTHDLLLSSVLALGAKVDKVVITDLADDVYYAEICFIQGEKTVRVDARPSDAIALALRSGAAIFVSEKIKPYAMAVSGEDDPEMEQFRSFLENVSPDDFRKEN
ncbi:MAG: bifunctional nuclease family protein [Bacillota bacterium]|jgi:bifunctional DNase/RNase|nr:bifunctional nuclease family protein [Bacillota bacterium]NLJ03179.1 bifunctional nuclease family protein [Bacillota bacterium]